MFTGPVAALVAADNQVLDQYEDETARPTEKDHQCLAKAGHAVVFRTVEKVRLGAS